MKALERPATANRDKVLGQIRHILTIAGTLLIAFSGVFDISDLTQEDVNQGVDAVMLAVGSVLDAFALIWSWFAKDPPVGTQSA